MKQLSILAGMLSLSSAVFGVDAVHLEDLVGQSESTLVSGVEFEDQEGRETPYSFYYPYQYEYYYPETGVDEEAIEDSDRNLECPCKKKKAEKKKKTSQTSRRRRS
ncbi:hypothetical protein C6H88_01330 [Chlamydia muridarum str. Nigg]|jgi:hypothetical protein|uniref:Uncharacterized protein n=2 Tax=Chlamydia muridarum TaxID=83560 RepID=A0A069ZN03_CHLMR|nr:hypothetical protein [Chlamydia muridarum]UFX61804.1 hypothetical protein FTM42_01420 [Chlamydia trachomatis]AAF39123.1 hypothetical protein TC_0254 [Chlamydia muridarum str. Nigg]AHH22644.1 hypothetical protein TAC_01335 [Chlamydia muridarum str. Nigg3 CMUT3-5]AHH23568.1 hypothetical protein Y015_01335 [Chlamydia muridarum str. Nigg CM972]AID37790.1 hypothetical protein BB17_01370 [Chlamydia muridarum str. Nigg 2 MCR]